MVSIIFEGFAQWCFIFIAVQRLKAYRTLGPTVCRVKKAKHCDKGAKKREKVDSPERVIVF